MPAEKRAPFFFGNQDEQLFGCLHLPSGSSQRECGVVLCYPFGPEYVRAHRSFVQLATRLSARGFPTLRFDYFGTGDSAGDLRDGTFDRWTTDVRSAVAELRRRCGTPRMALVGCRLGGMLSVLASRKGGPTDSLVLWDPVVDGAAYIDRLREMHRQTLRYAYLSAAGAGMDVAPGSEEVLGFALPSVLRSEVQSRNLFHLETPPVARVLVVESEPDPLVSRYADLVGASGAKVDRVRSDERRVWMGEAMKGIVPHRLLESIVSWLEENA